MVLFIRNVPRSLSRKELQNAVQEALMPRIRLPFFPVFAVTRTQFLAIRDKHTGSTERHGLVTVHLGKKAEARLRKLRYVSLHGKLRPVRPYVKRKAQSDPGGLGETVSDSGYRDPTHDRRRRNVEIEIERQPYVQGLNMASTLERNRA